MIKAQNIKKLSNLLPALAAFLLYYLTTCRSIWIGDSGEFALALHNLGIAHPPGYPLFTIAGRVIVACLPFLRPIFAASLFNIAIAATAVAVIYIIFKRFLSPLSALLLAILWAVSPLFWAETSGVEIYTLNILLVALTFLVLESKRHYKWFLVIYLAALSLTNHPSALAVIPPLLYLFFKEKEYLNIKRLPIYASLVVIASSIYLYMLIRANLAPISNWGNPATFQALIEHMTLKQYSGWVHSDWLSIIITLKLYFISLLKTWWWPGVIAVVTGIGIGWRVARTRTICTLLMLITSLILATFHQARNYEPFYLIPMLASLLLAGNIFIWFERKFTKPLPRLLPALVTAVAVVFSVIYFYDDMDKSDYALTEEYALSLLNTAEKGVLFTAGDINSFPTLYLRYVEKTHPKLLVFDRSIRKSALLDYAKKLTGQSYVDYYAAREAVIISKKQDVYLAKNNYVNEPKWLDVPVSLFSAGILYKALSQPQIKPVVLSYPANFDPGDLMSRQLLANLDLAHGEELLLQIPSDTTSAINFFKLAMTRMDHEPRGELLKHLGIYFRRIGFGDLALEAYNQALQKSLLPSREKEEIIFNISNVYKDRGNASVDSGDFQDAIAYYLKALAYAEKDQRLLYNIGLIYAQKLNDRTNARIYLEKYLIINPTDQQVRKFLQKL